MQGRRVSALLKTRSPLIPHIPPAHAPFLPLRFSSLAPPSSLHDEGYRLRTSDRLVTRHDYKGRLLSKPVCKALQRDHLGGQFTRRTVRPSCPMTRAAGVRSLIAVLLYFTSTYSPVGRQERHAGKVTKLFLPFGWMLNVIKQALCNFHGLSAVPIRGGRSACTYIHTY